MIPLMLTVSKRAVMEEVMKTSEYAGAKTVGDEGAYNRIMAADEDAEMLERFWTEACGNITDAAKRNIGLVAPQAAGESPDPDNDYVLKLMMPEEFNGALEGSMRTLLYNYVVQYVTAQWFALAGAPLAEVAGKAASSTLDAFVRMLHERMPPHRIKPQTENG